MTPFTCSRERDVVDMLHRGHWPQACPDELRGHVATCRRCSDLVLVTQGFQADRTQVQLKAQLPSAGALWWRAHLRRRNADLVRVSRPLFGAQVFALVVTLLAGLGVVSWELRKGFDPGSWFSEVSRALDLGALLPAQHPEGGLWLLLPVLAMVALVGGVVVYFASEKQ